jgi:hypothetical protein
MTQDHASPEDRIQRLEQDLSNARFTIIQLMPEQLHPLMHGYHRCETHQQYVSWQAEIIEKAIALAVPLEPADPPRAVCPLCGSAGHSPFVRGYTLPQGLRRHLWGDSNAIPCSVTYEVFQIANAATMPKRKANADAELKALEEQFAQRRTQEPLYEISLGRGPLLLDESLGFGALPRTEAELLWAEQRLRELGFQLTCKDRVKRYVFETPRAVVLADPRSRGAISFRLYKQQPAKESSPTFSHLFSIKDNWKHDLRGKFESRLACGTA